MCFSRLQWQCESHPLKHRHSSPCSLQSTKGGLQKVFCLCYVVAHFGERLIIEEQASARFNLMKEPYCRPTQLAVPFIMAQCGAGSPNGERWERLGAAACSQLCLWWNKKQSGWERNAAYRVKAQLKHRGESIRDGVIFPLWLFQFGYVRTRQNFNSEWWCFVSSWWCGRWYFVSCKYNILKTWLLTWKHFGNVSTVNYWRKKIDVYFWDFPFKNK
jgi:hypothetical protein